MATSTLLALIFVPAMYTIIDDFQNWILRSSAGVPGGPKKEGDMDAGSAGRISRSSQEAPRRRGRTARRRAEVAAPSRGGLPCRHQRLLVGGLLLAGCG